MAAERIGKEQVLAAFDMYKEPYFALFEGGIGKSDRTGRLLYSYTGDERDEEGLKQLQQNMEVLEATAPVMPHIIQFYSDLGKRGTIEPGTPYTGSFKFRMQPYTYDPGRPAVISGVGAVAPGNDFLAYLQRELHMEKEKNLMLEREVEEIKEELEDLERDTAGEPIDGMLGKIGEAGNRWPWLADIIKDWSTVIKHKVANTAGQQQQHHHHAGSMAGVATDAPPATRINQALMILLEWYRKEYGGAGTEAEQKQRGAEQCANDLALLARLTEDDDMMKLALKKLRALE
jgi:hypothetical protein